MPEYTKVVAIGLVLLIFIASIIAAVVVREPEDDIPPRGRRRRLSNRARRRIARHAKQRRGNVDSGRTQAQAPIAPDQPRHDPAPVMHTTPLRPVSADELTDPHFYFPAFADIAWSMPDVAATFKRVLAEHADSEEEAQ